MNIFIRVAEFFESWVNPFAPTSDLRPPNRLWGFIWHYVSQARWVYLAAVFTSGFVALAEAGFFYFIGRLVDILDQGQPENDWPGLLADHGAELAFIALVVVGGRWIMTTLNGLIEEQTLGRGFNNLVQWQAYSRISRQSVSFFANEFSGRLVTKVSQASSALHGILSDLIQVFWFTFIYIGTTAILFASLDWRMLALIVVWIACFALIARHFLPKMRRLAKENAEANARVSGRVVDSFSNIQTLKLFGTSEQSDDFVREGYELYLGSSTRLGRAVIAVRASLLGLSSVMVLAFGALCIELWSTNIITVGAVAFSISLVLRLNMMLGRFMGHLNGLVRNFGIVQNAMETIAHPIDLVDAPNAIDWTPERGHIRFDHVSFRYGANTSVLEDFNLDIAPGEKIGLIGRSGAGKTTIASLLLRFYDLDSGRITIDGRDISQLKQEALRAGIGVVTQDTSLLHRSIRANIMYGRPDASEEEMITAAKKAEAHEFILELSDQDGRRGYDAHVGERGVKLSGGQRQRIAIARVLLKNAPILVLDEATSALDSEIEAAIQGQLRMLMQGKTVIAIAHRLSTIAALDRLIVLERGRVVEQGTHHQLLALGGEYASLWARQSGGFLVPDDEEQKVETA